MYKKPDITQFLAWTGSFLGVDFEIRRFNRGDAKFRWTWYLNLSCKALMGSHRSFVDIIGRDVTFMAQIIGEGKNIMKLGTDYGDLQLTFDNVLQDVIQAISRFKEDPHIDLDVAAGLAYECIKELPGLPNAPVFSHSCEHCQYLGTVRMRSCSSETRDFIWFDLYVDTRPTDPERWNLIARSSDEEGDYTTLKIKDYREFREGMVDTRSQGRVSYFFDNPLEVAFNLARTAGFIKE